ncbi:MAG: hypothetical protein WDM91_18315 [Rhizomicrobium sp.]
MSLPRPTAFVGNAAINRVNLHSAIQAFAQGVGQVFILALLLRAGVSVPDTPAAEAAIRYCEGERHVRAQAA